MNSVDRTDFVSLRSRIRAWLVLVASAAACLAVIGIRAEAAPVQGQGAQVVPLGEPASGSANGAPSSGLPDSFAPVVGRDLRAVVSLSASSVVRSPEDPSFAASGSFFRPFFGGAFPFAFSFPRTLLEHSLGSGVIVKADGYILTNYHVVANAKDLRVILPDKREFEGRVLGSDPKSDLAVIKIDARNLPFIPLADSSSARPGDLAFALGNPFGADETVNMGVVSSMAKGGAGSEGLEDFVQTDAAINAGNSGGGLVNARGELIGINTAIQFRDASIERGVCFAVSSDMARGVMDQIIKNGRVIRGWLGITSQPLTLELARSFGLSSSHGALISDVTPGSPAAKCGLRTGDIITSLDGVPVTGGRELSLRVDTTPPGARSACGSTATAKHRKRA